MSGMRKAKIHGMSGCSGSFRVDGDGDYKIGHFNVQGEKPRNSKYPRRLIPVCSSFIRYYLDMNFVHNVRKCPK